MRPEVRGSSQIQWVLKLQVWQVAQNQILQEVGVLMLNETVWYSVVGMTTAISVPPDAFWIVFPCLQRSFAANNFVHFFALVRQAPYLLACLSHIYFGQVRVKCRLLYPHVVSVNFRCAS